MDERNPINPYEPPGFVPANPSGSPPADPPQVVKPDRHIVRERGILHVLPLIDFVNHSRDTNRLQLEYGATTDFFNQFNAIIVQLNYESGTHQKWLDTARQYFDVGETKTEVSRTGYCVCKLDSCDLSNPLLQPPEISGTDTFNVGFSADLIRENGIHIIDILKKYQYDERDYGRVKSCVQQINDPHLKMRV